MNAAVVNINNPNSMGGWFAPFTNRNYCNWFYFLMALSAVAFVLHVGTALYKIVSSGGKLYAISNPAFWVFTVMQATQYISARLLYSMCLNSI